MPIFRVKSVKIYTGQKKFIRIYSWRSWQIWGMTIIIQNKISDRKNPQSILFRSNVKAVDAAGGLSVLQKRCSKENCRILKKLSMCIFSTHHEEISLFDQNCFVPEIQSRCSNSGHPMVLLPWRWWPWTWRRLRHCELMIHCIEMRRIIWTVSQCELLLLSCQQFNWDASDPGFTDDFYQTMMANYRCLFKTIYIWYYKCKSNLFTFVLCEIQNSGPTSMLKARVLW